MSTRSAIASGILALSLCASLAACGAPSGVAGPPQGASEPAGEHVDGEKAKALVAGGARLVDVRGADEFGVKHIEGAENAPVETIEERDLGPKDGALVLYCSSGKRSAHAASTLRAKGYTRVYELGAMSNWEK